MKMMVPEWARCIVCRILAGFCLVATVSGCASHTEARIRHYFSMAPSTPLTSTNIQSALLVQFPIGTPSATVKAALEKQGMGKDGKSQLWQVKPNSLWNGNSLCCGPDDYSSKWLLMRRMQVSFALDAQQNVKKIEVQIFDYGL